MGLCSHRHPRRRSGADPAFLTVRFAVAVIGWARVHLGDGRVVVSVKKLYRPWTAPLIFHGSLTPESPHIPAIVFASAPWD